ncbi:MAG: lytic transglycosylase domain-containing protein [Parvularculaceae bacterium]|nr:lytic transglycosylase domain-containing protein [Parvularculaceae bacterium]
MLRFLAAFAVALLAVAAPAAAEGDAFAPKVLTDADRALYEEIFALQEEADWRGADRKIAALEDRSLLGYVMMERYLHPTAYRSTYEELKAWMAYYADHPEADRIYALAKRKRPRGAAPPLAPLPRKWRDEPQAPLHPELERDYAKTSRPLLAQIEGRVRHLTKREQASTALKEIENRLKRGSITARQFDRMRSWIAASLYYQGYIARAKEIADDVSLKSGDSAVLAYWISGLIRFREGDAATAHERFSAMAKVKEQEPALRSAAGFWASRTALAAGRAADVASNLEIAAEFPFTFYGQLALAQLGRRYDYNWTPPSLTRESFEALAAAEPSVRRAVALIEVGRRNEADLEFRWINGRVSDERAVDLLAVEAALDLPAAQLDLALGRQGREFEAGLFPIPAYAPANGFTANPALIYALMRQESKFKVEATSRVGARGLMQLMPRTASYMAKDQSLKGRGKDKLYDPAVNLSIGQDYVNHLIETAAGGDLFDMALAYNGGPGNLRRWKREVAIDDPLLFIESVPNPESRDFVEKVLTNFWVYSQRLGKNPTSRDRVAAGELPLYEAMEAIAAGAGK